MLVVFLSNSFFLWWMSGNLIRQSCLIEANITRLAVRLLGLIVTHVGITKHDSTNSETADLNAFGSNDEDHILDPIMESFQMLYLVCVRYRLWRS